MSEESKRPSNVDELLDNVSDLMDALHRIVDMSKLALERTLILAEKLGIESKERLEIAEEQAQDVHFLLYQWEDENTGTNHLLPKNFPPNDEP